MKIGICATHLDKCQLDRSLDYIGVDHGVEELLKQNIEPVYAIGDFDSLQNKQSLKQLELEILPQRKDVTDTHAAIDFVIKNGYDEIDIYGVTGGRLDHFLAALCLLEKYQDVNINIIDSQNKITLLRPGQHRIQKNNYTYFSLFALEESVIDIDHAHYPLKHYVLKRDNPLCVSNQVIDDWACVTNTTNILLIQSKDKI